MRVPFSLVECFWIKIVVLRTLSVQDPLHFLYLRVWESDLSNGNIGLGRFMSNVCEMATCQPFTKENAKEYLNIIMNIQLWMLQLLAHEKYCGHFNPVEKML